MTKWETMLLPLESVQRGEQKEEVAAESGVVTEKRTIYKQFISF